jgi:hypothetical protein
VINLDKTVPALHRPPSSLLVLLEGIQKHRIQPVSSFDLLGLFINPHIPFEYLLLKCPVPPATTSTFSPRFDEGRDLDALYAVQYTEEDIEAGIAMVRLL